MKRSLCKIIAASTGMLRVSETASAAAPAGIICNEEPDSSKIAVASRIIAGCSVIWKGIQTGDPVPFWPLSMMGTGTL